MNEWIVIKLGGSLLSPYETATKSLKLGEIPFDMQYARELLDEVKNTKKKVVFVIGGGFLNRWYLKQLQNANFGKLETVTDFHVLGMAASDINATIFRMLAGEIVGYNAVFPEVVKYEDYPRLAELQKRFSSCQIVVAAGWKPGHSHDVDALMFASLLGLQNVYSFKNIDGIYTGDPKKDPTAVKKKTLSWEEYRHIIKSNVHLPGASFPIDAVAARLAEEMHKGFVVIDGRDIRAVREVLEEGVTTRGTTVKV